MRGFLFFVYLCIKYSQMINSVRNTVLAVANKHNFGYISPADFNLYAKQAQLDIFENYFYRYNEWIAKQNARVSGSGYADIVKNLEEVIDTFSVEDYLYNVIDNKYKMPNEDNNSSTYYLLNKVLVYTSLLHQGVTDGFDAGNDIIEDSTKDFSTVGVGNYVSFQIGDNIKFVEVLERVSTTELRVDSDLLNASGVRYTVYANQLTQKESERVSHSKITMLNSSNLTSPSTTTPAFTQSELTIKLYPESIRNVGRVMAQYIRKPKDPKWTYTSFTNGEPLFNQGASDYQDFELPATDEPLITSKILQYAGISIREADIYQAGSAEEMKDKQKQG